MNINDVFEILSKKNLITKRILVSKLNEDSEFFIAWLGVHNENGERIVNNSSCAGYSVNKKNGDVNLINLPSKQGFDLIKKFRNDNGLFIPDEYKAKPLIRNKSPVND